MSNSNASIGMTCLEKKIAMSLRVCGREKSKDRRYFFFVMATTAAASKLLLGFAWIMSQPTQHCHCQSEEGQNDISSPQFLFATHTALLYPIKSPFFLNPFSRIFSSSINIFSSDFPQCEQPAFFTDKLSAALHFP